MKLAKGVVFFFLMGVLGSCFNPPEFPIEPTIEFESLIFKKGSPFDSLILSIRFKDGDGDLGIDPQNPDFSSYPYHPIDYFLEKDGELIKVATENRYDDVPPIIKIDAGQSGKLITNRTREQPGYQDLPVFNCYDYNYDSIYVSKADKNIFDGSYFLKSIIPSTSTRPEIYFLLDTFYIKPNLIHHNITIHFETKNTNGTYTEVDLNKAFCGAEIFDGRFPVLSENKAPLDGTLRYGMASTGFLGLFGGKTIRLKIQIRDRALHESDSIYSSDLLIN